jgi:transposase
MARALCLDLRRRVVNAVAAGLSCRAAAERFGVGASSAIRWVARARETGDCVAKKPGGDRRSFRIDAHASLILGWTEAEPDLTLAELSARLDEAVGYRAAPSVHRFFERHGVTRKKRPRTVSHWNAIGPSDNGERAGPARRSRGA